MLLDSAMLQYILGDVADVMLQLSQPVIFCVMLGFIDVA